VTRSSTHLVLIPSYNTGPKVLEVVREARRHWEPVWIVVDGSTDGSGASLERLAADDSGLRVLTRARNGGKGAAVFDGLCEAEACGFTHVLIMDADGQHPAASIPDFMALSQAHPLATISGIPVFDRSAPRLRVLGRRISNTCADLETLWVGIGDSLFGFRVYPIAELQRLMAASRWMRGFDFDPEAVVRLCWRRVPAVTRLVPVRYFRAEEGGVSHFHYLSDNLLLTWMHARLLLGFVLRLPLLLMRRFRSSRH
jgi:glycosyltransferase involved in cell wall biosynthesis